MNNLNNYRDESDAIGIIKVPSKKYWGAQTQRSLENFKIGEEKIPLQLIHAFAIQKKAAAISNLAINKLEEKVVDKIIEVCDEIIDGKHDDQFPLSVWQTGSGTQTNMNLNEVIANRANELLGEKLGSNKPIHPNDHCNMGQSSNDSFPTAMHIAIVIDINKKLTPALAKIIKELGIKEKEFSNITKIGRTHLQDAVPLRLSQEFSAFKSQVENGQQRVSHSLEEIYNLAQGGTAVGTGLNSSKDFVKCFIKAVQEITKLPFKSAKNKFESLASHDSILNLSGSINSLVTAFYKLANDIRLLSSGPRCGISEITIPSNEPGSSIMPGKVNPTQSEALAQVCIYLMSNHFSLTFAASQGHFQLNANKTLIIFNILRTIGLLSDAINSFVEKCLIGIKPNIKNIKKNLENSLMLVTALNPVIGYDKSSEIAKIAFNNNISLKEAASKLNYITEEEFDKLVDPNKMID